jgi:hypothetical protein
MNILIKKTMAKLVRVETDYRFYVVELTDEQLERYNSGDEGYDEVMDEVCDDFEFTRDKDGGTEYYIEE